MCVCTVCAYDQHGLYIIIWFDRFDMYGTLPVNNFMFGPSQKSQHCNEKKATTLFPFLSYSNAHRDDAAIGISDANDFHAIFVCSCKYLL